MSDSARNGWETCPPGEFSRLSTRLRASHRRRDAIRGTVAVAVAVVMGSVMYQSWSSSWNYHFAGLSCTQVMALAPGYAMGKLAPERREQVREHVDICPHCKPLFQMMGLAHQKKQPRIGDRPLRNPAIEEG